MSVLRATEDAAATTRSRSATDTNLLPEPTRTHTGAFRILDAALETIGTGSFQHRLMLITGFGQFVDAAETALVSLVYPLLVDEWHVTSKQLAVVGSATGAGMMVGSWVLGRISDTHGRKAAYGWSLLGCSLFSFISSFANDVWSFALFRFLLGICYGGNMIACTTLLVEFVKPDDRGLFVSLAGVAYGVGAVAVSLFAWWAMESLGWRNVIRVVSLCAVPVLLSLQNVPESVRFLIMKRRWDKAVNAIGKVAKANGKTAPIGFTRECLLLAESSGSCDFERDVTDELSSDIQPLLTGDNNVIDNTAHIESTLDGNNTTFEKVFNNTNNNYENVNEHVDINRVSLKNKSWAVGRECHPISAMKQELRSLAPLWRETNVRNTLIPLTMVWFFNAFGAQIFFWIPLESKNIFRNETGIEYEINFTISLSSFLGTLLALWLTLRVSRLQLLRSGTAASALCAVFLANSGHSKLMLFVSTGCLQVCYAVVVNTLYLYSPEVFATKLRVSAFAICMLGHRIAPTVAPQILTAVIESMGFSAVCWVLAGVHILAYTMSTLLTVVTFNVPLVE